MRVIMRRIRDRLDEWPNPIMVKEMYQSVHSRAFMAAFWLLLVGALLTYYFVWRGGGQPEDAGKDMFSVFAALLGVMAVIIIPVSAFVALHGEVRSGTVELVKITGMGAGKLVRGRLWAAAAKTVLLYAVVAPFAVASFFFGGVDAAAILVVVYMLLLASFGASALGVLFGAMAAYRGMRVVSAVAFIAVVAMGGLSLLSALPAAAYLGAGASLDLMLLLLTLGGFTVLTVLGVMLLNAAAANALRPESMRSSARGKLIGLGIIVASFLWMLSIALVERDFEVALVGFAMLSCPFLALSCTMWMLGDARPRRTGQWSLVLLDGPGGGLAYLFVGLALVGIGELIFAACESSPLGMMGDTWQVIVYPMGLTAAYVPYLSALARAILFAFPRPYRTPMVAGTVVGLLLGVNGAALLAVGMSVSTRTLDFVNSHASAFVPLIYVSSLEAEPGAAEFLSHMAPPFLVGVAGHVLMGLHARRRRRAAGRAEPGPTAPASHGG